MKKDEQPAPDINVTDETYQGPTTAVVVAGHGSIEHLVFGVIGLFGAGAIAFLAPKSAAAFVKKAQEAGKELKTLEVPGESKIFERFTAQSKRAWGGFLRGIFGDADIASALTTQAESLENPNKEWFESVAADKKLGFGGAFVSHTLGMFPFAGKYVRAGLKTAGEKDTETAVKVANAITVGGLAGAAGYMLGWGKALLLGGVHGNTGRHQFERAKKQIKNLQEDNADLNKINDELHTKYVNAATRLDSIQAAQDNAIRETAEHSELPLTKELASTTPAPAPIHTPSSPTEVQLSQGEHQGKLAEKELAVA